MTETFDCILLYKWHDGEESSGELTRELRRLLRKAGCLTETERLTEAGRELRSGGTAADREQG